MEKNVLNMSASGSLIDHWIDLIGTLIDLSGVTVIVAGILWATVMFIRPYSGERDYENYKIRIGRSLLLGLELLVAADIVKTIAIEPTFLSLGVLAGLVVVRTFLSWTLTLEIAGHWPWQQDLRSTGERRILNVSQVKGR
jgi:uncharacterized membrane protein